MTIERRIAALFRMDDAAWARHANPWSGWTRVATGFPLIILAVWSRVWIGWWAILPVAATMIWLWLNPRLFPPPASTENWMSQGVLGERLWLNRDKRPIPQHHHLVPHVLSAIAATAGLAVVYGLVVLDAVVTISGALVAMLAKMWFIDRMVWIYRDMCRSRD